MYMRHCLFIIVVLFVGAGIAVAQTSGPATAPTSPPSAISELDTYVKVVGAVITGLATLLGLPIVFVTYRKTRVEISKLELEANALRAQQASRAGDSRDEEGNIRILVDHSPNTSIQVLADPRFLALSFSFWTSFSLG